MTYIILYHVLCLALLALTYAGSKGENRQMDTSLETVYISIALIIVMDCLWSVLSGIGFENAIVLYLVNIVYFIAETLAVLEWVIFSCRTTGSKLASNRRNVILIAIPAIIGMLMALGTPVTGHVFSIVDGEYVRGSMFFIDSAVKLLYLVSGWLLTVYYASKEPLKYLKKKYYLLSIYCIPVMLGGLCQAIFGIDINCAAPAVGLAIVYKYGLANEAKDNADLVKAIASSYEAVFIIDVDNHSVKAIMASGEYSKIGDLSNSLSYEDCVNVSVRLSVMPEDKLRVEQNFAIDNVLRHLESDSSYAVVYKVYSENNQEKYNRATFMKAFSDEDRHEIFLGIEEQEIRQVMRREQDDLTEERENFERVKESFTTVVANVIEARDVDSGEHVMRVKGITQRLCYQLMQDYPEYGLTPIKIRYITNGSALHDIGKIMIPDSILLKPGKLTEEEFEIMKTHCEKGCTILDMIPENLDKEYVRYAKEICRWHHEKYDGRGYPDGLSGDDIPISAQIVSLADCYDALTTKRVYRDAIPRRKALNMIYNEDCGVFNIDLLDCLSKVINELPK